jgi:hypothetical protein
LRDNPEIVRCALAYLLRHQTNEYPF